MKFATTFLMALSLGMLSLGCGDGATESANDPAGPDTALEGPSTDGEGLTGSTDEANEGGEAAPDEAKPAEAKPAEAKPAEAKPAEAKPAEAKPAPKKKG
jgi:hypothetical protein